MAAGFAVLAQIATALAGMPPSVAADQSISPAKAQKIATCVARIDPKAAGAFVAAVPGTDRERSLVAAFDMLVERCTHDNLAISDAIRMWIAGAFAEQRRLVVVSFRGFDQSKMENK